MNQKKRVVLTVCAAAAIVSLVPFRSLPSATMVKGQETATALPEVTPDAGATSTPVPTGIPATPAVPVKKLPSVKKVKVVRFSTHSVKLTWKKQKKTKYYHVFVSTKKDGKYRKKLSTKNNVCLVKKLKNKTKYYFYITAGEKKQLSETDSNPSKVVSKKMKTYVRTTVFAGDSITEGLTYEGGFAHMPIGGKKRTIAYRGLNTVTFHTKRVFHGRTGLQKLIAAKPYRVYMMLGMNEIHYQKISNMLSEYRDMLEAIKQSCPDTDIIVCAISPVTRAEKARHPGFWQRPVFNRKLKKLAKKMSVTYLDYTDFLKDSKGYLKAAYATGDGYHWKPPAYAKFGKILAKYDRQRDGRGGK